MEEEETDEMSFGEGIEEVCLEFALPILPGASLT
jgi:hypothetical protein